MKSRFREPTSGYIHLAGAILTLPGTAWLIYQTMDYPPHQLSVSIYGISLLTLYASSTVMHLFNGSEETIRWLVRADHAAIYILIAGSYTPICIVALDGLWRIGLMASVWIVAIVGVCYKLIFGPRAKKDRISTLMYIGMGWLALFAIPQLLIALSPLVFGLIIGGGLVYTAGALIKLRWDNPQDKPLFGIHDLWHLFVIAGSALHYVAIAILIG